MPRLNRELTVKLIDVEFGLSAAIHRGEKPPNGVRVLSERTGIPRRTLSGAVYGGDQIAEHRIARIAHALNVKPDVLKAEEKKDGPKEEKTHPDKRGTGKGTGPKRSVEAAA
jgi:transcriptional regulator with XRE-family HTH domain